MAPSVTNAQQYRESRAVPVEMPSGAVFRLRRPPIQAWLKNGRMPQFLTAMLLEAQRSATSESALAEVKAKAMERVNALTEEEQLALLRFQADAVAYSMVMPRLILPKEDQPEPDPDTLGEDALLASELDIADFNAIFAYAMNGSPTVPVLTTNGEATLQSVEAFRDSGAGSLPVDIGADVSADWGTPEPQVRDS